MLRLPIGWQDNSDCVNLFVTMRLKMCELMAKDLCCNGARKFKTKANNKRLPDPDHYLYLDKLLNSAQMKIDIPWGGAQHRVFHQLGEFLASHGCAEKNAKFKGTWKITDEKEARDWLKTMCEEKDNKFKLVMRYAHH